MTNNDEIHGPGDTGSAKEAAAKRLADFKAQLPVHLAESVALEREAVTLYQQYGFFLPGPAKAFFRKLAIHLQWQDLMKVTK